MKFEQDENEKMHRDAEPLPPDDDIQWTKEEGRSDTRFDFAAFLGPEESLDDKITEVLGGQDLLHPDSYGDFSPDYVPHIPFDGEHGRHEAPGSDLPEEPEQEGGEEDFQEDEVEEEAPPRPKVVVAEPAPRVYVTPDSEYDDYEEHEYQPARQGLSGGQKLLVGVVIAATVIVVGLAWLLLRGGGEDEEIADSTPAPTLSSETFTGFVSEPAQEQSDDVQQAEPVASTYIVTVTAGTGGTVDPSGAVSVEEGGSVSFSIQPDDGYIISQILVDGSAVSVDSGYTFSDVTANHTLYVVFQAEAEPTPEPELTPESTPEPTPEVTPEPEPEAVTPEEEPVQEETVQEEEPVQEETVHEEEPAQEETVQEEEPAQEETVQEEEPAQEEVVQEEAVQEEAVG